MKKTFLILVCATFFACTFTSCHKEHDCTCTTTLVKINSTATPPINDTIVNTANVSTTGECSDMNTHIEHSDTTYSFSSTVTCE